MPHPDPVPAGGDRPSQRRALALFGAAAAAIVLGVAVAAARFPGGFDWAYTVISRLGSPRHNPGGAHWLTGSLLAAALLLWPVVNHLARSAGAPARAPIMALRLGLLGALLLGLEGLLALDLSRLHRKGHELVALVTFAAFYAGVLGLHLQRVWAGVARLWGAALVVAPLCAVGASQLALYLGQRDLGWVNTGWRELGVPVWLSFALWQWLAVAFLGLGLAHLLLADRTRGGRPLPAPAPPAPGARS
jgi:hypothetical protein